jgi:starvation-inducible DNA-binding protein
MPTHPSRIDIPAATRDRVIAVMNARLADGIDLMLQAKQAHWNAKGPWFATLHALFDMVNATTADHVDLLAERVPQLGGVAEGTLRVAASRSGLAEYPLHAVDGRDHVQALATGVARFGALVRDDIAAVAELGDAVTADLLTEISRANDKLLWLLEAHLQGTGAAPVGAPSTVAPRAMAVPA